MSQIFSFQSHSVRTLSENDKIWFAAQDVCRCLGLKWTGHKLNTIPDAWQKLARYANFSRSLRFISEPVVYKLAFRSNKPEADVFTNWVASEVLPAIRKKGSYSIQPSQFALPTVCEQHDELLPTHVLAAVKTARRSVDAAFCELAALSDTYRRKHLYRDKSGAMTQIAYAFSDYHTSVINGLSAAVHLVRAMSAVDQI